MKRGSEVTDGESCANDNDEPKNEVSLKETIG